MITERGRQPSEEMNARLKALNDSQTYTADWPTMHPADSQDSA